MKLDNCLVKGVKADIVKGRATITLNVGLDDALLEHEEQLVAIVENEMLVNATIEPHQMEMKF